MKAALDVQYDDTRSLGAAAAVVFDPWDATTAVAEYTAIVDHVKPYVPGQFYRRELPCLLSVFAKIKEPIDLVVVDSYVDLGERVGLGGYLHERLLPKVPIIGVAKTKFLGAAAAEITRGQSKLPLYITSIGIDLDRAAAHIRGMYGPYRMPFILRRVDRLAREKIAYGQNIGPTGVVPDQVPDLGL